MLRAGASCTQRLRSDARSRGRSPHACVLQRPTAAAAPSSSEGRTNMFASCVPRGIMPKPSPSQTASTRARIVRLIVLTNRAPPGRSILAAAATATRGSGRCSTTSQSNARSTDSSAIPGAAMSPQTKWARASACCEAARSAFSARSTPTTRAPVRASATDIKPPPQPKSATTLGADVGNQSAIHRRKIERRTSLTARNDAKSRHDSSHHPSRSNTDAATTLVTRPRFAS